MILFEISLLITVNECVNFENNKASCFPALRNKQYCPKNDPMIIQWLSWDFTMMPFDWQAQELGYG